MDWIVSALSYALAQPVTLVTMLGACVVAVVMIVRYLVSRYGK